MRTTSRFTTQQRHVMRALATLVVTLDSAVSWRSSLQGQIAAEPDGIVKQGLLRQLAEALATEEQAVLHLRDAAAYLSGLVVRPEHD
ncbi:MAG TPA: hypothetical protein VHB98_23980 [Chloroflexota bacterium]|nr:hypothetical protein [Chloroflexota bacterium]